MAIFCLAFWLIHARCGTGRPGLTDKLDSLLRAYAETQFFSGVVLVAKDETVLYHRAFGAADRERPAANLPGTRFNIASTGKTFTAVLVMRLVEQGKLDLAAPISTYLPADAVPNADKITAHHLLTHTSGLSNYMLHPKYAERRDRLKTLADAVALVSDMPPAFSPPGGRFLYSNSGYIVLGRIIEAVTGKPYVDHARETLWGPLGMTGTSIDHPPAVRPPREAVPYYVFSPRSFVDATPEENPGFSDGGAFSNAPDLFAFARALLTDRLLKPETRARMLAPRTEMDPRTKYGYGWFVMEDISGRRFVGHSGGGHGYSSDLKISMDDGRVIILLANVRTAARRITENIVRLLETGEPEPPQRTLESFLFGEIEARGVREVLADLETSLASREEKKLSTPSTLAGVADALAAVKRPDEARSVLERNAELFPGSPMPLNALAEFYVSQGKPAEAVRLFQKALAIDPNDEYASIRLKAIDPSAAK